MSHSEQSLRDSDIGCPRNAVLG